MKKITRRSFVGKVTTCLLSSMTISTFFPSPIKAFADDTITTHNAEVERLWEEAVKSGIEQGYEVVVIDPTENVPIPYAYTSGYTTTNYWMYGIPANVGFNIIFNSATNQNGTPIIGQIYSIGAYAVNEMTQVEVLDSRYIYADGQRTVIANYTLRLGVYDVFVWKYATVAFQVEFYANGNGHVF